MAKYRIVFDLNVNGAALTHANDDHASHAFDGEQCACGAYRQEAGIADKPCPLTDAYDEETT
jgi:hypothetical protein